MLGFPCVFTGWTWWYYWCIGAITGALLCTLDFLHPRHSTAQVHQNHLEERLLDQAQAPASYTPPFLGSFA